MTVVEQKIASLQRCVTRARQARLRAAERFRSDLDLQDVAVLNIVRACDIAIDPANIVVRRRKLCIPGESRDSFRILAREGLVAIELADRLQKMVGFHNLAVHQYQALDLAMVEAVIDRNLGDLLRFADEMRLLPDAE